MQVNPSIIAPIAYVLLFTLAQAAVITDKRIQPSDTILRNKTEERFSTAPRDEYQSTFIQDGVYRFLLPDNDHVPNMKTDITSDIDDEPNNYPINITITSNHTPGNKQSTQSPSKNGKMEQFSKARKMMGNLHVGNDQGLTVDTEESNIRRKRHISCNNRYTGDCQDLETASICPWRYTWDSNGPQNVECLTCKPTVGCDDNCLLTCQPWYIDGRAVACLAALPCTHASRS